MTPGPSALTRIRCGASSRAWDRRHRDDRAARRGIERVGRAARPPWTEAMLTIDPCPLAARAGTAAAVQKYAAPMLSRTTASKSAGPNVAMGPLTVRPALFTRMSRPPSALDGAVDEIAARFEIGQVGLERHGPSRRPP